jgi:uncharacterized membrane protein
MPYQWLPPTGPEARVYLWPHRSLPRAGFVWFIGITAALIALPMLAVTGSPALWVILPFAAIAVAGVWFALKRSYRDGQVLEDMTLTPSMVTLTRHGPHGQRQAWEAHSRWVRVILHPTGGPVPNYLTLQGGPREVELGAFLSEDERIALRAEVQAALARLRG